MAQNQSDYFPITKRANSFKRKLLTFTVTCSTALAALGEIQKSAEALPTSTRVEALLAEMTVEEKAAQLQLFFALPFFGAEKINNMVLGGAGSLLYVSDPKEINRLQRLAMEKTRLKIPLMFALDVVHGYSTIFPVPIAMAASWDTELVAHSQTIAAEEASAIGIRWTFAPTVDVTRDPRWGRIVEGAGEDPYLSSAMAAAQVRGFQGPEIGAANRLVAGVKHFAGYGAAVGGRDYDEVNLSDAELRNVYLPPFQAAIDAGAGNVMTAYMPLNGIPATANRWLLTDVLRDELGFKGWVVSDNSTVKGLLRHGMAKDELDAAASALSSGLDMEMAFGESLFTGLPEALTKNKITERQLDDAVRRILEIKIKLGLFENPYVDEGSANEALRKPGSVEAARVAAEKSAVLLKNENNLLPLDRTKFKKIAVIGPLANSPRDALGPWVNVANGVVSQSILDGMSERLGDDIALTYTPGVAMPDRLYPSPLTMMEGPTDRPAPADDKTGIAEALKAAKRADVALLVLGETHDMIGEIASRSTLELPGRQQDLLDAVVATGKPVIVLLMSGRPLNLKETQAQAIMQIWYPGSQGGSAVANLLFGESAPGGKLPFTWPRNVGQIPQFYAHLSSHDAKGAYSRYWNEPGSPTYPFGYGLSYSTFSYGNLALDKTEIAPDQSLRVTVDLTNTGARVADEVAQLYIHQRSGRAARPVRELKGFMRVTLQPGETRTLDFILDKQSLQYWHAGERDWVIDESEFDVAVGGDSSAPFSTSFTVIRNQ